MRNFGRKSLDEIKERLAARGLIEAPEPVEGEAGAVDVDEMGEPVELGQLGDEADEGNRPGDADQRVVTGGRTLEDE
jgi:hypothetical protein